MEPFIAMGGLIILVIALVVAVIALALLPTIIAWRRKHPDLVWIFVANIVSDLFAAVLIGVAIWIFALIWAFKSNWRAEDMIRKLRGEASTLNKRTNPAGSPSTTGTAPLLTTIDTGSDGGAD